MFSGRRNWHPTLFSSLLALAPFLAACGQAGLESAQSPTDSPTPSPVVTLPTGSPSPTQGPPQTYADPDFGFKVEYPENFSTLVYSVNTLRESHDGFLRVVVFRDRQFEGKDAPGGVNIRVYDKNSDAALDDWIRAHSAPKSEEGRTIYFKDTSDLQAITVAGRQGMSFDWDASDSGIVHARSFFYETYVVVIQWSGGGGYESAIEPVFEQIVSSWKDG